MIPLQTQEQFESLLNKEANKEKAVPQSGPKVAVYFTANWCGACKRLDWKAIEAAFPDITWYKCDIDENDYTLGYCGLKSLPSFAFIKGGKFLGTEASSNTEKVIESIRAVF